MRKSLAEVYVAAVGVAIGIAWLPVRMRFPFDDTYITFRYAAHIARGLGIVWNAGGPHTEGYTNFLYVLLLAPFSAVNFDLVGVSQVINVFAVIVTAIAIFRIVKHVANTQPLFAMLAVALFYLNPFTWYNAFSGMETSVFTMFVMLAISSAYRLEDNSRPSRTILPYLFITSAALTRPEGALLGIVVAIAAMFRAVRSEPAQRSADWKRIITATLLGFILPLAIYAAWKLWYFGDLLPNSFYVKVAQANPNHTLLPGRGAMLEYYERAWYLVLPILYLIWMWFRHKTAERGDLVIHLCILWLVFVSAFYTFSQLMMPNFYRFFNSIEAVMIVLVSVSIYRLVAQRHLSHRTIVSLASVFVVLHIALSYYSRHGQEWLASDTSYEHREMQVVSLLRSIPDHEHISVASADAGIIPYYSKIEHVDLVGLNTTSIAHDHTTNEVIATVKKLRPSILFVPMEVGKANDSCRAAIRWGHGLIGQDGYSQLAQFAADSGYVSVGTISEVVYDFNVLVDRSSSHFADIQQAFAARIGNDSLISRPVSCVR